jgi:hypothetical protein
MYKVPVVYSQCKKTNMKKIINSYLVIIMVALLPSCSSYSRNNMKLVQHDKGELHQILYYASLAGSSHNSQPWKAEVYGEDSILVYADLSRKLPVVDPTSRELYISIGAFIENLDLAASCYGFETDVKIISPHGVSDAPVATLSLSRSDTGKEDALLKEIELRTTLRIPFDTAEIRHSDWKKLVSADSVNIHYLPSTSDKGIYVKQKELEAYTIQAKNKNAQDELASWIRFSNKDVKEKQDGLTTAGMGIKGVRGFVVRNFFKPEDSKKESFVTQGIEKTKLQVENCGGWIVITMESDNIEAWINTGRLYQRMNIECRNMNIGFHPMNQIAEETDFEKSANDFLDFNGKIMFIARIGYVKDYPSPVSVRRPVESFATFR